MTNLDGAQFTYLCGCSFCIRNIVVVEFSRLNLGRKCLYCNFAFRADHWWWGGSLCCAVTWGWLQTFLATHWKMNSSVPFVLRGARLIKSPQSGVTLCFQFVFRRRHNNFCFSCQNRLSQTLDIWDKENIGLPKCTGWPFYDLDPRSRLWHW